MDKFTSIETIEEFKETALDWLSNFGVPNLHKDMRDAELAGRIVEVIVKNKLLDDGRYDPDYVQMDRSPLVNYSDNRQIYGFFTLNGFPLLGISLSNYNCFPYYGVIYYNSKNFRLYVPQKGNILRREEPISIIRGTERVFLDIDEIFEELEESFHFLPKKKSKNDIIDILEDFTEAMKSLCPKEKGFIDYKTKELKDLISKL